MFKLDCLPIDEEEFHTNCHIRKRIIDYIAHLQPVEVPHVLELEKTECIRRIDSEKLKKIEGEIQGYKDKMSAGIR